MSSGEFEARIATVPPDGAMMARARRAAAKQTRQQTQTIHAWIDAAMADRALTFATVLQQQHDEVDVDE